LTDGQSLRNVVIGSGPCGVACATALSVRGEPVTMLDVGATLEPERAEAVDRVRSSWLPGLHLPEWERIKRPPLEQTSALPLKLAYGSDFPYTEDLFVGGRPPAGRGWFHPTRAAD
jgi:choline dehydrogenase-like flavoprotein